MQRIKLLFIITKLELGGAQKHLLSLIRHLNREKIKPFLFTAQTGELIAEAGSIEGLELYKSRWLERPINPFKDILAIIEIYSFIKKNRIDIVHTHSSKAGILGRLAAMFAGVKVILHTVHGWSFHDYQPRFVRLIFTWLERLSAGFTDRIIAVSDYDKQKGLASCIGRQDRYALIRYGIDYAEFSVKDSRVREELGLSADELTVGMIACFKPQKSPQDFIKLAHIVSKSLPGIKFILVGDGVLRRKIERLVRKLKLEKQVILTGWRRDITRILSAIDIFVLTSLWEGLPIAALEAMAAAKPVIATDTGGIGEIIRDKDSGFLIRSGDIDTMSKRLSLLLSDANLRKRMGEKARINLGVNFSLDNMLKNTEDLYASLALLKKKGV